MLAACTADRYIAYYSLPKQRLGQRPTCKLDVSVLLEPVVDMPKVDGQWRFAAQGSRGWQTLAQVLEQAGLAQPVAAYLPGVCWHSGWQCHHTEPPPLWNIAASNSTAQQWKPKKKTFWLGAVSTSTGQQYEVPHLLAMCRHWCLHSWHLHHARGACWPLGM